jgi:hypothetical protein
MKMNAIDIEGKDVALDIDRKTDECPICHYKVDPKLVYAQYDGNKSTNCLQAVFRCTNKTCLNLFIAYYSSFSSNYSNLPYFQFQYSAPSQRVEKEFSKTIYDISQNFPNIYNQAYAAEQSRLNLICGPGYRKALEFLIKDYLIKLNPGEKEAIRSTFLGKCISEYVTDEKIKEVAKRAAWLGNDETHYLREWEDKDVQVLKDLIDVTVYWIDAEELTKRIIEEMPDKKETNK